MKLSRLIERFKCVGEYIYSRIEKQMKQLKLTKKKGSLPAVRVNTSKGYSYSQFKGSNGKWETIGRLDEKSLSMAYSMMIEAYERQKQTEVKALAKKHGIIVDNLRDFHRFDSHPSDKQLDEDMRTIQEYLDAQAKMSRDNMRRFRQYNKRTKKAMRKMVRKISIKKDGNVTLTEEYLKEILEKDEKDLTGQERSIREAFKAGKFKKVDVPQTIKAHSSVDIS
jgi:hypothetical protein